MRCDRGDLDHDGVAPNRLIRLLEGVDQLLDGSDARHRLLGEGEREGHGPDQPAVDVYRAPAHAAHHSGLLQGAPGKAGQNGVLAGTDVLENSQNFRLEFFNLGPRKTVFPIPFIPGLTSSRA